MGRKTDGDPSYMSTYYVSLDTSPRCLLASPEIAISSLSKRIR